MSLETWKAEYYPKPAEEVSKEEAVQHSLQKWVGLRTGNLEKHGLMRRSGTRSIGDRGDQRMYVDNFSCALCRRYYGANQTASCAGCPLHEVRGGIDCDEVTREESRSPFHEWSIGSEPEPMIEWLRKAAEYEEKK